MVLGCRAGRPVVARRMVLGLPLKINHLGTIRENANLRRTNLQRAGSYPNFWG